MPPEDGEPTSFAKAKDWVNKHKPTILAVGGAVGSAAVAVAVFAARRAVEQDAPEATEDTEPAADSTEEKEQRNSPGKHNVAPHKRRLADGREIDVSGYERGGSSEDEDEDPGAAAA
jgi:pyruvate/2-oxoglutarate dehydrogenase complex dihydrolipoamide acyltransferase (E2) component